MGTPFITFLGPSNLGEYDRYKKSSEQSSNIPKAFIDAMEVREQVFVEEQGVPLANEFDSDDARACHWVSSLIQCRASLTGAAGCIRLH
jgi:predicted GNAT family N-acyltransferase